MIFSKNILVSLTLVSGLAFAACNDDDPVQNNNWAGATELQVSKTDMGLVNDVPGVLVVKSPAAPKVTSDSEWLRITGITPKEGSQSLYNVELAADVNPAYTERSANITVSHASQSYNVKVTQFPGETVRIVSVEPETLLPEGGTIVLKYTATGEITYTLPSWCAVTPARSITADELHITYGSNVTGTDRSGEITIALADYPSVYASVSVSQAKNDLPADMSSTARQLAAKMYAGVNIGNTLEAPDGETAWGQPMVNMEYIRGLKALGFNAVRVPCAWNSHVSDASANTIDPAWLDRVNEVVGYIIGEGMYAIVNIHWDGGWLEESCANGFDEAVDKKQHDYWTQIANRLGHYDEHLLFAGMNEPGLQNGSDSNTAVDAIMKYQQTFLDAVRATGGNNAVRCLIMQAPATNINEAVAGVYALPKDVVSDRMFVEVHQYDPSDFTLMTEDGMWGADSTVKLYWGATNHLDGSDRNCTWGEESHIDAQFKKMQDKYVSAGIPVIVGEYAVCETRTAAAFPDIDLDRWKASRAYWNQYLTASAKNHGCVPFYWETGGDISRHTGAALNAYAIDALMQGAAQGVYPF